MCWFSQKWREHPPLMSILPVQAYCSSTKFFRLNFRMARHPPAIRHASMECPYQCYLLFLNSTLTDHELLRGERPALELLAS
jgi:hypothetical protein